VAPVAPPPPNALTAEAICDRFAVLKPKCPQFADLEMEHQECVAEFKAGLASADTKPALESMGHCMVDHDQCEEVVACLTAAAQTPEEKPDHACDLGWATKKPRDIALGPAGISRAEWDNRNGAKVTAFHEAKSTMELPIEMCGIPAENEWLMTLHCKDGSQPIKTRRDAELARHGNLGSGGRCGSIIDKYTVKCPEASYDIYLDGYVCPLDH
jgi:hypothetical protein